LFILSKLYSFGLVATGVLLLAQLCKLPVFRTLQKKAKASRGRKITSRKGELSVGSHHGFPHL